MNKTDMSANCDFMYSQLFKIMDDGILSVEDWNKWYDNHCGKCMFMSEICMYDECMALKKKTELTSEEVEAAVDALNAIGCTSFYLTPEDVEKIVSDTNTNTTFSLQEVENS